MRKGIAARSALLWMGLAATMGCTSSLSGPASKVVWVNAPQQVAGCEGLGIVEGSSSQSGPANIATGRVNARNEALEQAAARGATHVHWLPNDESWSGIHSTAEAFRCEAGGAHPAPLTPAVATAAPPADAPAGHEETSDKSTISTGTCFFVADSGLALSSLHVVKGSKYIYLRARLGRGTLDSFDTRQG